MTTKLEELRCYSTVAGELVNLVRLQKPMCLVPYEQAKALQDEVERLRNYIKLTEGICG